MSAQVCLQTLSTKFGELETVSFSLCVEDLPCPLYLLSFLHVETVVLLRQLDDLLLEVRYVCKVHLVSMRDLRSCFGWHRRHCRQTHPDLDRSTWSSYLCVCCVLCSCHGLPEVSALNLYIRVELGHLQTALLEDPEFIICQQTSGNLVLTLVTYVRPSEQSRSHRARVFRHLVAVCVVYCRKTLALRVN